MIIRKKYYPIIIYLMSSICYFFIAKLIFNFSYKTFLEIIIYLFGGYVSSIVIAILCATCSFEYWKNILFITQLQLFIATCNVLVILYLDSDIKNSVTGFCWLFLFMNIILGAAYGIVIWKNMKKIILFISVVTISFIGLVWQSVGIQILLALAGFGFVS